MYLNQLNMVKCLLISGNSRANATECVSSDQKSPGIKVEQ